MTPSARLAALLALAVLSGAARAEDRVLITQVGEVEVGIFMPGEVKVLRGVIVHAANYKLKPDDRWAELCHELEFAHVAMNIPNVQKATNRHEKLARGLHEALKEFSEKSGHAELVKLPLAGTGHSAGGLVTGVLLRTPERTLTNCVDCGWVMDPQKLPEGAAGVPALFTMGAVPDAFKMLPSIEQHYDPARKKGLPWGLGVQWGCAHDFGNSATLVFPWMRAVARARLPEGAAPADGVAKLRPIKVEDGWLGDRTSIEGNFASVASFADFKGDRPGAAWFPNREVAYVWRAWQSKDAPLTLEAATDNGKAKLPAWGPKVARDLIVKPGENVELSVTVREGTAVKEVQFYDGDRLLGAGEGGSFTFLWKKPASGTHAVWARWEGADGKPGVTNPALVIVRRAKH